jgi:hypothetical protein
MQHIKLDIVGISTDATDWGIESGILAVALELVPDDRLWVIACCRGEL